MQNLTVTAVQKSAEKIERRRYPRTAVNRPVRIWVNDGKPSSAQLMNISPYGALLSYSSPLPPGTRVRLKFYLHTNGETILLRLTGEVRESQLRGESHLIRVVFLNPPIQAVKAIYDFTKQQGAAHDDN